MENHCETRKFVTFMWSTRKNIYLNNKNLKIIEYENCVKLWKKLAYITECSKMEQQKSKWQTKWHTDFISFQENYQSY